MYVVLINPSSCKDSENHFNKNHSRSKQQNHIVLYDLSLKNLVFLLFRTEDLKPHPITGVGYNKFNGSPFWLR